MTRKVILFLHRWLGLLTGIVVFFVSITGCLYVFSDELRALFYHDRNHTAIGEKVLPLSVLKQIAENALGPEVTVSRCDVYTASDRSWVFRAIKLNPRALTHWGYYVYYYRVYMDPYSGKALFIEDSKNEFFQLLVSMHMRLLLGPRLGHPVVGYSVLLFVVLLVSGLFLWWPSRWTAAAVKKSFRIKTGSSFKRLNYDLHNVPGFYVLLPALVIAFTGLIWSFEWVDDAIYRLVAGGAPRETRILPKSVPADSGPARIPLDIAFTHAAARNPDAAMFSIRFPEKPDGLIDITARLSSGRTYQFRRAQYDRFSGKRVWSEQTDQLNRAEKLRALNYDLHVGSFLGLPGKLLAFFASLVCASLPVTGFLIWYNRGTKTPKGGCAGRRSLAKIQREPAGN